MKRLIILRGYPGSGKTTVGKILASKGYGIFIDHNAILTFIASYTENDDGIYDQINQLEMSMTKKLLQDGKSVIIARGFGKRRSMEGYLEAARLTSSEIDVVRLEVSSEKLALRVQSPNRTADFNPTKTPAALNEWMANNPLEYRDEDVVVDAGMEIEYVIQGIQKALDWS